MKRVLVVDDDLEITALVRKVLEADGISVSVAPNGQEALRMAERDRPDVVLLDIMMPGMDGVTVLAEIRRRPTLNGMRVVMLTAKGTPRDSGEALRVGADAYVTKPFTFDALRASVSG